MCVVLYQGSKICGCYVLMFGNRIVMKKIQKSSLYMFLEYL